ncbi:hypothetical protein Mal64_21680 [Pseudobythopirellula maris]|uniref:DUF4254 domain-containing protein n=1 Tax=Pseudobythopirellula maris TaxID=2527991 RepID=A0A5C5ZPH6_9BACT|nr:DUF4254 domain-containing protein [Pseudobythopirellula maris]TWT88681.1 hypothetical protein Mal64_21680 [Pseudobythopirellula maris]
MTLDAAVLVRQITELQAEAVVRWHVLDGRQHPLDNPYTGLLSVACQQHQFNYQLWHEEDVARRRDVTDERIAQVKRAIDGFNQQRNDWIERIDETLIGSLGAWGVEPVEGARLNTETPGSAVDRLSIMSLRVFHLEEELSRDGVDRAHVEKVRTKLARCEEQAADLAHSLTELLEDIFAGRKLLKVYRQMKMYNDPTLNPYLNGAARKAG